MDASIPTLTPLTTLPTSPSYIHLGPSLPSTPSLLSRQNSFSRPSHLPSSRSHPNVISSPHHPNQPHPQSLTPRLPGQSKSQIQLQSNTKRRRRSARHYDGANDDDWLTRTASALTLSGLEEKGQSWLAARESSTSLSAVEVDEYAAEEDVGARGYGYATDQAGVQRSRYASARSSFTRIEGRRSRRGTVVQRSTDEGGDSGEGKEEKKGEIRGLMGPDFVNKEDEEEMRAAEGEVVEEDEDEVDEGEMKSVIMGRIGGWVGWTVGWMDFRGDGDGEDENGDSEGDSREGLVKDTVKEGKSVDMEEVKRRLNEKGKERDRLRSETLGLPPPPSGQEAGLVSDARWLWNVALGSLRENNV